MSTQRTRDHLTDFPWPGLRIKTTMGFLKMMKKIIKNIVILEKAEAHYIPC